MVTELILQNVVICHDCVLVLYYIHTKKEMEVFKMLLLKFIIYTMMVVLFLVFLVSMINCSTSKTLSIEDRKIDLLVGVVSFVFLCLLFIVM